MRAVERLEGKRILIWGYGREGQATENFIKRSCNVASVDVFEGKRDEINEELYDYIIKSPGIVMEDDNDKYTSQTDLFLEEFRDQIIGVTGTKGKSTTSAMLYEALKNCYDGKVILLGNIGLPCLDYYEEIDENTIIVFEMSCHQLAHLKVAPHVAVFLNLYEEHLDYYRTFERYFNAKKNIALSQNENDYLYIGANVPEFETKSKKTVINENDKITYDIKVLGEHNKYNAYFVERILSDVFNADMDIVKKSLQEFSGLPHRLQFIGNVNGVDYFDDSISTIPNATIQALGSVKNAKTVIIGGMDRGIDYSILIDFINNHREYNYIFAYESGKKLYDVLGKYNDCHYTDNLEAAVALAKDITKNGEACILSPAAASYGYFKNFEERGDKFKEYVLG